MKQSLIPFNEYAAPIKKKIGTGLFFGITALIVFGMLAFMLGKTDIFKAGAYVAVFALLYAARYVFYAAKGRVHEIKATVMKVEEDKLIPSGMNYTLMDADGMLYKLLLIKHRGKAAYEKNEELEIYMDRLYLERQTPDEQGAKSVGEPLAIIRKYA